MSGRALFLIGSPKGLKASNSARYGEGLATRLESEGWTIGRVDLHEAVATADGSDGLCRQAQEADLVVLIAPLYVDTLPGPTLRALEILAERSSSEAPDRATGLAALIHCGFIEPAHNKVAVALCREFAQQAGWMWRGALMLGGGGMPSKRARSVLEEAGDALARGGAISAEIAEKASKPTMPVWLYILGGNAMWRRVAKKRGISPQDLRGKPYA